MAVDRNEIVSRYLAGEEVSAISATLGSSQSVIRYHLRLAGVPARRKRNNWPVEQMRQWYEVDGLTEEQIGAKLNRHRSLVHKVCVKHKFQMRRRGPASGDKHPDWKGGRTLTKDGYVHVYMPEHPMAKGGRYVLEHRLVMEQAIGRPLERREVVHHRNNDKTDNRIENLELFSSNGEHLAQTIAGQCPNWTEDGIDRIAAGVAKRHGCEAIQVAENLRRSVRELRQTTGLSKDEPEPAVHGP